MTIGVAAFFGADQAAAADRLYAQSLLRTWAALHPEHRFLLVTNDPGAFSFSLSNVQVHQQANAGRSFFSRLRQQYRWRKWLRQQKPDVLFFFGASLKLYSKIPFFVFVREWDKPGKATLRRFRKRGVSLFTASEKQKDWLANEGAYGAEKITVVGSAAPEREFIALDETAVKEKFTDGREYYLHTGLFAEPDSLIELLKAFSLLKKRQKTSYRLLLVNRAQQPAAKLQEALKTYKYRADVALMEHPSDEDVQQLLGAAYAFVHPDRSAAYGLYLLEAAQRGLPLIVPGQQEYRRLLEEDALYFTPDSATELAEQMMRLYKDEDARNRYAASAKSRAGRYAWEQVVRSIGQQVQQAAKAGKQLPSPPKQEQ